MNKSLFKSLAFLLICFPSLSIAIDAYTIIIPQVDPTGNFQISRLIAKPSEESYLRYNYTTNLPMWEPVSSLSMSSSQIDDSSSIGRDLMTAADQEEARGAIGAGTSNFSGNYSDLVSPPTNLNQFTNGPGFVTALTAPVLSVNSNTGAVVLGYSDVGAASASHAHTATDISDGTSVGRAVVTASTQSMARTAIGAEASGSASAAQAYSVQRVNHTGTQPLSTITFSCSSSQYIRGDGACTTFPTLPAKYTGTTNGSGIYSVTYGSAYSVKPHLVFSVEGGTNKDTSILTSTTATGFSILVERRSDVIGLLPTYAPVSGIAVNVTVTP